MDFLRMGRRIFLYTRPDGTFLVSKPKCCRRVFQELNRINRGAKTFLKKKQTLDAASVAWNHMMQKNKEIIVMNDFHDE